MAQCSRQITAFNVIGKLFMAFCVAALAACGGGSETSTTAELELGGSQSAAVQVMAAAAALPAAQALAAKVPVAQPGLEAQASVAATTVTAGVQTVRAIGALSDGGYTVAWRSQVDSGTTTTATLHTHRYDALGVQSGTPAAVALDWPGVTGADIGSEAVAILADGSMVVAYAARRVVASSATSLLESSGIYARRFNSAGAPMGGETEVFSFVRQLVGARQIDFVAQPAIVTWQDGSYLVGWNLQHDLGALGTFTDFSTQRFDPQGAPAGNAGFFSGNGDPCASFKLTAIADGGYLIATTHCYLGSTYVTYSTVDSPARSGQIGTLFDAGGLPAAETTLVPLSSGGYALWSRNLGGAYLQMLDGSGKALGAPAAVAALPAMATALRGGGFVGFWQTPAPALLAQRFDATGAALGEGLPIETGAALPLVSALNDGGFALAWTATNSAGEQNIMIQWVDVTDSGALAQSLKRNCKTEAASMAGRERTAFMTRCLSR